MLLNVCKHVAARPDVPWPTGILEASRSCYEGKILPSAMSAAKQPLPVFPELLEEPARSWAERPKSGWSPISGASALENLGLLYLPPLNLSLQGTSTLQSTLTERV